MPEVGALGLGLDWTNLNASRGARDDPARIKAVAGQFEALMVGEMLKTVRSAGGGGWFGAGSEDANGTIGELAEMQLAQALSARGGLGLAPLVEAGLRRAQPTGGVSPSNSAKPG
jgi:Rod binding domain-containing protein